MTVHVHHTIADLYRTLGLPCEGEVDFSLLSVPTLHPELPYTSSQMRAEYFSFILTRKGAGTYFLDDQAFPFGPQSLYFTNPGHTKSYRLESSKEALILTLSEKFLREHIHPGIYEEFPFLLAEFVPPVQLSPSDFEDLWTLYAQIETEFKASSPYKNKILGNLFMVFLLKIKGKFWANYDPIQEGNRDSQIVRLFKKLLEQEFKKIAAGNSGPGKILVQDFANELHLHPNYLNAVIKSKTGKTANDWISKRTLSMAKTLLKNSPLSAKEIAYRLGYSEPTHFSRFFKNQTGISPQDFRKLPSGS
jgi:AraC-like DNA-binding protein